jgi:pilus assembly protein Flp/PilA
MGFVAKIAGDRRGATAVEYALILSLMVIVMIGSLMLFADRTIAMWNGVAENVAEATS